MVSFFMVPYRIDDRAKLRTQRPNRNRKRAGSGGSNLVCFPKLEWGRGIPAIAMIYRHNARETVEQLNLREWIQLCVAVDGRFGKRNVNGGTIYHGTGERVAVGEFIEQVKFDVLCIDRTNGLRVMVDVGPRYAEDRRFWFKWDSAA